MLRNMKHKIQPFADILWPYYLLGSRQIDPYPIFIARHRSGEGYVFSRVCPSFCAQGESNVTITHDGSDLALLPPPPTWDLTTGQPWSPPHPWTWDLSVQSSASDIWWPALEICSNIHLMTPISTYIWWQAGKQAVCILLEWFLVIP